MRWNRIALVLLLLGALAQAAPAGIIFGKKPKANPAERIPELIVTIKTEKDESRRVAAAAELREYDTAANPEIVHVLIDVMLNDAKPSVRAEAADSLGKIRPITKEAGWALEQAMAKDASMRVRLQARYALLGYQWNGYESVKVNEPIVTTPPAGTPGTTTVAAPPGPALAPVITPTGNPPVVRGQPVPPGSPLTMTPSTIISTSASPSAMTPPPAPARDKDGGFFSSLFRGRGKDKTPTPIPTMNESAPPPLVEPSGNPPVFRPVPQGLPKIPPLPQSPEPVRGPGPDLTPPGR